MRLNQAIGEMVQKAYEKFGGNGNAEPVVIRPKDPCLSCELPDCDDTHPACAYNDRAKREEARAKDEELSADCQEVVAAFTHGDLEAAIAKLKKMETN